MSCARGAAAHRAPGDDDDENDPEYDSRLIDNSERPDVFVMRQELAAVIQVAIGELPPTSTTLVLADIEGMDYQEIADTMGTALGTVKSRLSRARIARYAARAPGTFTFPVPSR